MHQFFKEKDCVIDGKNVKIVLLVSLNDFWAIVKYYLYLLRLLLTM